MTVDQRLNLGRNIVIVGIIRFGGEAKELLEWALMRAAGPGDNVVAIHVCKNSGSYGCLSDERAVLDGYLEEYQDLCNRQKVALSAKVLKGNSIRKSMVKEARNHSALAVIVGITKHSAFGGGASVAKYCANKLPPTTQVIAIHKGKIIFSRQSRHQSEGFSYTNNFTFKDNLSEFGESVVSEMSSRYSFEASSPVVGRHKKGSLSSISLPVEGFTKDRPGWPLLLTASSTTQPTKDARKMSVVKWVMSLPNRPLLEDNCREQENGELAEKRPRDELGLYKDLEVIMVKNSSGCEIFSHDIVKMATSEFSSENFIGKGGCNSVYKGILPEGKPVAIKILESSKDSRKDFMREIDIMTSLKHKNIAPLLGICMKDSELISVYDFLSRGNLEENLQRNRKENSMLTWEVRFRVAVGIAGALNYLHEKCSKPVIHRDVKSSNILLTDKLEPQLSDFGLARWGPTATSFVMDTDVVGTFGYMAPEYFMYGRVSVKIDVYAYGVVLLELLSGRKPIGMEATNGQESLVMWAKPKLESGDLKSILDPNLDGNIDEAQMQRMALAATLCLTQASRLRPKMSRILSILKGEDNGAGVKPGYAKHNVSQAHNDDNDDEVFPVSRAESHLSLAFLDINDNSESFSSVDQSGPLSVEAYLKGRWSRSSSLE